MATEPTRAELEGAHCWFPTDGVSGQSEVTAFRRRARLRQARWREQNGLPIGSHEWDETVKDEATGTRVKTGRRRSKANGSRLDEECTKHANFLAPSIAAAVEARLAAPEPHQTLSEPRLRFDLLSSMPLCFNLFGALHDDPDAATAAVRTLWPDLDVAKATVRFEWSPDRRNPRYTDDRTAFDAAFEVERADGARGVIGIETKYHECSVVEVHPGAPPKAGRTKVDRLPRYREITARSGAFVDDWETAVLGTDRQQVWRDHLLLLSMLQTDGPDERGQGPWTFGRYVLVHPAGNPAFAEVGARYREVLADATTFETRTIEHLLDAHALHTPALEATFRERYLFP